MTAAPTTLASLAEVLETHAPDAPLIFATTEGEIGAGYHVTELKRAEIESIDCGGRVDRWRETHLQLLDGAGEAPMPVGRFLAIARQSVAAIDGLGAAPLRVEFAPANAGLRLHRIAGVEAKAGRVRVALAEERALCKPAAEAGAACGGGAARVSGSGGCCAPSKKAETKAGCCA